MKQSKHHFHILFIRHYFEHQFWTTIRTRLFMMQVQWRLDHALFNIQLNTRLIKHLSNYEPQLLNDRCAWFCTGIFFISLSTKSTVKLLNMTKVKISIVKMRFVKYFFPHQILININFKILLHSVKEKINYIYPGTLNFMLIWNKNFAWKSNNACIYKHWRFIFLFINIFIIFMLI